MALLSKREGTENYPGGSETHIFPCESGACSHYVKIDRDHDFADGNWFFVELLNKTDSWKERFKACFTILRGRENLVDCVIITEEVAKDICEALGGPYPPAKNKVME